MEVSSVQTARAECLDWTLIWNRRHLERVLAAYLEHYNTARPHRGILLRCRFRARHLSTQAVQSSGSTSSGTDPRVPARAA